MKKRKKRKNKTGRAEITLEKTERTLLRFGLELILNGLAGANAGSHPHAHPLALMSPQAANVYRNRAYNEEFAAKLISLRNRVSPDKGKKQFRLDAFDLAAAALGLRVTRKNQLWRQASDLDKRRLRRLADPPETDAVTLLRKLESARKRAERRIRKSIQEQHKELAKTWKAFVDWIRFNLLYVNEAQRQRIINREIGIPGSHRKLAKLRFQALLDAAREVIKERTTAQIPESELLRLVKLARNKSQPSRRPHNVGIVDLERDPEKAKDFMFDFIIDRDWEADGRRWELQEFVKSEPEVAASQAVSVPLTAPNVAAHVANDRPQKTSTQERALLQSPEPSPLGTASKTSPANTRGLDTVHRQPKPAVTGSPTNASSQPLRDGHAEPVGRVSTDISRATPDGATERPLSQISEQFREGEVINGIIAWLTKEFDPAIWPELISMAQSRMRYIRGQDFRVYPHTTEELTMERLFQECCPAAQWRSGSDSTRVDTDVLADWVTWVLTYVYHRPNQIRDVLQKAIDIAWRHVVTLRSK